MKIKFSKMHGLGNDFVLINNLDTKHKFSSRQLAQLADRKHGIGCDQVLLIEAASDGHSDFYYRIYNGDGSEAQQCGNGARCFIEYVVAQGLSTQTELSLQTNTRVIVGRRLEPGLVEVNLGAPQFEPAQIPLTLDLAENYQFKVDAQVIQFAALSLGNPHAVIQIESVAELDDRQHLATVAKELQASGLFPQGVNVNFVYFRAPKLLQMVTYERGCGFTLACGSGAAASAALFFKRRQVQSPLTVTMPGGSLQMSWDGAEISMCGPACHVFEGEIELCAN